MSPIRPGIRYTVAALVLSATAIGSGIRSHSSNFAASSVMSSHLHRASTSVYRQRQRGAVPVAILSHQDHPAAIALDDKSIYWISDSRSSISKVGKAGGMPTPIVTGQEMIRRMVLDGDKIYFNTEDAVKSVSKTGGIPVTLATIADDTAYYYRQRTR